MSEEDKAEARRRALVAIATFRDGGCVLPPPPDAELVREMMAFLACEPVPDNYVELMLEELELDGIDHRRIEVDAPDDAKQAFPVLVIGCGQSGLLAGIRLKEMGLPFTILEKNTSLGGTWWENHTPAVGSTSATTSIATRSNRPTIGASTSRSRRNCISTSSTSCAGTASTRTCGGRPRSCAPSGTTSRRRGS